MTGGSFSPFPGKVRRWAKGLLSERLASAPAGDRPGGQQPLHGGRHEPRHDGDYPGRTEQRPGANNPLASMPSAFGELVDVAFRTASAGVPEASFCAMLADLDDDEAESVLRLASTCPIRDAFTAED